MDLSEVREYRKGNWTVEETRVLIEAKKMDEERRMKRPCHGKPPELRWKWVEDYCWGRGCFRSQNQCNDKWDNLMRDFKKVREYEGTVAASASAAAVSYWKIDKHQRKERSLPSNLSSEIYEALMELTEKIKSTQRFGSVVLGQQPPLPTHPPPPPFPPAAEQPPLPFSQPLPTVDCERSEDESESESAAKRRKRGEGRSGGGGGGRMRLEEAISESASIIVEAMQWSEEREGRREREMMRVRERRLEIEQSKAEINRRGIHSLVDAVNKLADSIFALANQQHSSKS